MKNALRSEILKLRTVRSTYIAVLLGLVIAGIINFYALGMRASPESLFDTQLYQSAIRDTLAFVSIFGAIISILLMTNEYRFNTITYTLTSTNSRIKSLLAKIGAVSLFTLVFTVTFGLFAVAMLWLGLNVRDHHVVAQVFYIDTLWHILFGTWASMLFGLLFAVLIRSTPGSIITYFIVPSTVEGLLRLIMKDNVKYLPFNALSSVTSTNVPELSLSPNKALLIVLAYLIGGWAIASYLFVKRDAN